MRSKIISLTFIFISLYVFNLGSVHAQICEKKGHSYCNYDSGITFTSRGGMVDCGGDYCKGYFLRKGYTATMVDGTYSAFCLDPALAASKYALTKVRSLDLKTDYDKELYRIYQQYVNELQAGGNFDYNNVYFEYALRMLTIKHNYHYISSDDEYANDGTVFIGCSKILDKNIITEERIANLSLDTSFFSYSTDGNCFGDYKDIISFYYNERKKTYLWKNPFDGNNIEKKLIEPTDEQPLYIVEFKVDLTGFWDFSKAIDSLGLKEALFTAYISVNDNACKKTGDCNANNYSGESYISKSNVKESLQNNYTFSISFTKEQYEKMISEGATVSLNYSYNHPMDYKNIMIVRENAENQSFQRMVVIKENIYEDSEIYKLNNIPIVDEKKCKFVSSGNYIGKDGVSIKLEDFIKECGCFDINYSVLSNTEKIIYDNSSCSSKVDIENFWNTIEDCKNGENYQSYELGYYSEKNLNTNNKYCTKICTEKIEINNLAGKFTTKAGTYFKFDNYPSLTANKKCQIDIDYSKWESDYERELQKLVDAYNNWKEAVAASKAYGSGGIGCDCYTDEFGNEYCLKTKYSYNGNYKGFKIEDKIRLQETDFSIDLDDDGDTNDNTNGCGNGRINLNIDSKKQAFENVASSQESLNNLIKYLKQCNNELFNIDDPKKFYEFKEELDFYYEQTLSKDNKTVRNDKRASYNAIDDSKYKSVLTDFTDEKNDDSYFEPIYHSLNQSGNITEQKIKNYYVPKRDVSYTYKYTPKYYKYSMPLTGKIKGYLNEDDGESTYKKLGYVYDTDATAIAQKNNDFYYLFSKLGDSNNKIYNKYKDNNYGGIIRMCDYEIKNDIMYTCEKGYCDTKLNIIYRSVDPSNIDPNDRLTKGEGFNNWKTENAQVVMKKIKEDANKKDTYSPKNLEYSFTLDSGTLQAIREYNVGKSYDDFTLECTEGNECKSDFISDAYGKGGISGASTGEVGIKFGNGSNIVGRDKWKNIKEIFSGSNKWIIDDDTTNIIDIS